MWDKPFIASEPVHAGSKFRSGKVNNPSLPTENAGSRGFAAPNHLRAARMRPALRISLGGAVFFLVVGAIRLGDRCGIAVG